MVDPFTYTLDDTERRICLMVAQARHDANRAKGRKCRQMGGRDQLLIDREGLAGEIVFGKVANLFVDLRTEDERPPAHDFNLPGGRTIDIKTTRHKSGMLLSILKKAQAEFRCDFYGLVVLNFNDPNVCPTGRFMGGIAADDYLIEKNIVDKGYGRSYGLTQRQLIPPGEFIRLVCDPAASSAPA